jgi:hypothetical protein
VEAAEVAEAVAEGEEAVEAAAAAEEEVGAVEAAEVVGVEAVAEVVGVEAVAAVEAGSSGGRRAARCRCSDGRRFARSCSRWPRPPT